MRIIDKPIIWLLLVCIFTSFPAIANEMNDIVPGHWLEIRGTLDEQGDFIAARADLVEPETDEVLIGTISEVPAADEFFLLGQAIQISQKTRFSKVDASNLLGTRVKVEGHYRGQKRFSARKVSNRGAGRDRIVGLVSDIQAISEGYLVTIMNHLVRVPGDVELRHEKPIQEYAVASLNIALPQGKQLSEDDQFGEGIRINDRLRFTTLTEARYKGEDNYDLDDRREQDRKDTAVSIRGRFILAPGEYGISGQLEVRYTHAWVNDDVLGHFDISDTRLGESFIYLDDPFRVDFDIQAGRMDFDDRREWLYDQNLDGLRVYWNIAGWLAEHLNGEFEAVKGRGGPGDEHSLVDERKAWERKLGADGWIGIALLPQAGVAAQVVAGSHDPLLEWALRESRAGIATFFDGSLDGVARFCASEAMAVAMHIYEPEDGAWNVPLVAERFAQQAFERGRRLTLQQPQARAHFIEHGGRRMLGGGQLVDRHKLDTG